MSTLKGGIQRRKMSRPLIGHPATLVVLNNHVHSRHQPVFFNISTLARNQGNPTECDFWREVRSER